MRAAASRTAAAAIRRDQIVSGGSVSGVVSGGIRAGIGAGIRPDGRPLYAAGCRRWPRLPGPPGPLKPGGSANRRLGRPSVQNPAGAG